MPDPAQPGASGASPGSRPRWQRDGRLQDRPSLEGGRLGDGAGGQGAALRGPCPVSPPKMQRAAFLSSTHALAEGIKLPGEQQARRPGFPKADTGRIWGQAGSKHDRSHHRLLPRSAGLARAWLGVLCGRPAPPCTAVCARPCEQPGPFTL